MNAQSGFTLIEMLIATVISVAILGIALQIISASNRVTATAVNDGQGIQIVQQAVNVISDDVRNAIFMDAPGSSYSMGSVAPGAPTTVGNDLILMVTPVRDSSTCTTSYELLAYYFATRSAVGTDEWTTPSTDASNSGKRVLMQFAACIPTPDLSGAISGESVRLVADYLGTGSFAISGFGNRYIKVTMASLKTVGGRAITGKTVSMDVFARNIY